MAQNWGFKSKELVNRSSDHVLTHSSLQGQRTRSSKGQVLHMRDQYGDADICIVLELRLPVAECKGKYGQSS